ncbi:LysR substrate-binding domain-containing protein [Heyndrickxia coagulans]|uniref:LysR substrate-binding domain-containing protein n=1 Tax=Heyndrickxia coagulans TaxID=1398 RepID=UPI00021104AE|nr:LysR substrate-binding domain-containing protein [Heyndrickxia coagulans]AEH54616.1 transcriptional regulator, LysR family [Heyndrickxia coagulans 2-6]MED4943142.1 LysR substrate-binding domain-containing protein [Heyndrickxia coagulans]MED4964857.1 LysR substrate-binding domain-containing protein [Heyndrickxia coagulans]
MNIKDLQYYKKLYQEKRYTKVANFFHVSQPAITAAIQRLEKELGTQLIIRDQSHHEIRFTESGRQFERHATQMLKELDIARKEIQALKMEKVSIGLPPIIGNYYFPAISSMLAKENLLQNMNVYEDGSQSLFHKLLTGKMDMALLGAIHPIEDEHVTSHLLARKKFKIIVSPQHSLATRKSVAFQELKDEPFIQLSDHFIHPLAFEGLSKKTRTHPPVIYRTNDIQIIKGMVVVAENVGISFFTEIAVPEYAPVIALSLADPGQPEFLISLAYRSNHILTPLQQKLVDVLTKQEQRINGS